jgi:hypothetical protein
VQGELDGVLNKLRSAWQASRRQVLDEGVARCCGVDVGTSQVSAGNGGGATAGDDVNAGVVVGGGVVDSGGVGGGGGGSDDTKDLDIRRRKKDELSLVVSSVPTTSSVTQADGVTNTAHPLLLTTPSSVNNVADERMLTRRERVTYALPDLFSLVSKGNTQSHAYRLARTIACAHSHPRSRHLGLFIRSHTIDIDTISNSYSLARFHLRSLN